MKLRPLQLEAIECVERAHADGHDSVLVVAPTGFGKTVVFLEMVRRATEVGKRVIIIVDRLELVSQTVDRMIQTLGIYPDIEQGDFGASTRPGMRASVVVAIIQTLRTEYPDGTKRYQKFRRDEFDEVIVDEAHLSITPSYAGAVDGEGNAAEEGVVRYFMSGGAKVTGLTATPKRADGRSLAQLYPHNAFEYRMLDAINDGWLVPVHGKIIPLETVSLQGLRVSSKTKDFTDNQIGKLMENEDTLYNTVSVLLRETRPEGERPLQTIVFCARVNHARLMAAAINKHLDDPNAARAVYGDMPNHVRRPIIDDFKERRTQYLVNCAVLTTGFDAPCIDVVAMCRPTKSWALFAQCVGRGTRPLPGVVDGLETADERLAAISESEKPHVTVLSFVGREGAMNLIGPEDVLAGDMEPPEVMARTKELLDEMDEDADIIEVLEEAREQIEKEDAERPEDAAPDFTFDGVEYETLTTDWFDRNENILKVLRSGASLPEAHTESFLLAAGYQKHQVAQWTREYRDGVVRYLQQRERTGMCTLKQANLIRRMYPRMTEADRKALTKQDAGRLIKLRTQNSRKVTA